MRHEVGALGTDNNLVLTRAVQMYQGAVETMNAASCYTIMLLDSFFSPHSAQKWPHKIMANGPGNMILGPTDGMIFIATTYDDEGLSVNMQNAFQVLPATGKQAVVLALYSAHPNLFMYFGKPYETALNQQGLGFDSTDGLADAILTYNRLSSMTPENSPSQTNLLNSQWGRMRLS